MALQPTTKTLTTRKFRSGKLLRASIPKITVTDPDNITRTGVHASTLQEIQALQEDYDENERLFSSFNGKKCNPEVWAMVTRRRASWGQELACLREILWREEKQFFERQRREARRARRRAWLGRVFGKFLVGSGCRSLSV